MLDFRKLDVYRYAVALLELAAAFAEEIPRPQRTLADRLGRAALSVVRAIAEGSTREPDNQPEARHCYAFARGSAFECVALVDALESQRALPSHDATRAREVLTRVISMLCTLASPLPL
jgi:four helix bundle protein